MKVEMVLPDALCVWLKGYGGSVQAGVVAAARVAGYTGVVALPPITATKAIEHAAAAGVQVARNVITTACVRGAIKAEKSGGTWMLDAADFERWLTEYCKRKASILPR